MNLPSVPELRKQLIKLLDEGVKEKMMIDSCNEQLKVIREDVKEKFELSSTEFNNLLKAWYDESKAKQAFEQAEDIFNSIEILKSIKK